MSPAAGPASSPNSAARSALCSYSPGGGGTGWREAHLPCQPQAGELELSPVAKGAALRWGRGWRGRGRAQSQASQWGWGSPPEACLQPAAWGR